MGTGCVAKRPEQAEADIRCQYRSVDMHTGRVASHNVDSLSAFFPGLQVLMGDLQG